MKKRIFALALALCMMLSVMPTSFAGNGFLTLDGQENVEEQPREQQQEGILTLDDPDAVITQEPEEEPVYGVLTPDTPSEEPKAPVVEQSEGVLYVECPECGYLDGYHADDCPTIQPEEQEPVRQPETSLPAEDVPVVSTYSAENVSSAQTARTLTVVRNASTYNLLRNSLMSVYDTRDGASTQAEVEQKDAEGLVTSKDVTYDDDKKVYTVTLEAYTTGEVTTSTKTIPVDIVLVLDQSGSMADDFNGNFTITNSKRRQYAMKQAINNFISSVSEKYSEDADHRISIVTFSSDANILQGWTYVNEGGKTTLQGKISGLPDWPDGATNISAGMGLAENLMGEGYNYTGTNTQRQKVVVAFTDGVPTTETDFDVGVANGAISFANALKKSGVTIYSVGIFNGANPDELYGASGFDTNSDGTVGSQWIKDTWGLFPGTDFPEADRPACNRFLNLLSSNYSSADSVGLSRSTKGLGILHYKITYEITENYSRSDSSYYLTAKDSDSLNNIFQTISDSIETANIDLGSTTEVRDVISPYFDLPENVSESEYDIKLYTAAAKADGTFEEREQASGKVKATISSDHKTVSVTGFDFNANFVSETAKEDGTYGKKLIITFDIVPNYDTTLGGSGIASNGDDSGIYSDGTVIEHFERPTVDVKTDTITPTVRDQNIYLSNPADLSKLLAGTDRRINGSGNAGVDVTYTLYQVGDDGNDTAIATLEIPAGESVDNCEWTAKPGQNLNPELDSCTEYYIVCEVVATKDGRNSSTGTSDTASVHVYKPEVTFKDSTIYLSQTPVYKDENYLSEVWKDDREEAPDTMGAAPTLVYDYTPVDNSFDSCTDVNVTVKIDEVDVTEHVTFANGESSHAGSVEAKEFTVHVLKPSFTVTCTDLYADFGADVTMDEWMIVGGATWNHECEEVTYPTPSGWELSCNYEYTPADMIKDGKYTMGDEDQAFSVAVTDFTIKDENGNTATYPKAGTVLSDFAVITYKNGETATNAFTIHINKFNLTITKNWGETEAVYQHDVIVALMCGDTKICDVVVPKSDSITITGLICGKDYTLDECENWAWRFTNSVEYSSGNKATHTHALNVSVGAPTDNCSVTAKITNTLNKPYWFDAIAETVKNIFGKGDNQ